jgi:aminopeptidase-like protein
MHVTVEKISDYFSRSYQQKQIFPIPTCTYLAEKNGLGLTYIKIKLLACTNKDTYFERKINSGNILFYVYTLHCNIKHFFSIFFSCTAVSLTDEQLSVLISVSSQECTYNNTST